MKPDKEMVLVASKIAKALIETEWLIRDHFYMEVEPDKTLRVKVDPEVYVIVSKPENKVYDICIRSYENKEYGEDPDILKLLPVDSIAKAAQEVVRIRSIYKTYRKDLEKIQGDRIKALKWGRDKK